jgi:hypothetical protein
VNPHLAVATADIVATRAQRALMSASALALWPDRGLHAEESAFSIDKEVMQREENQMPHRGWLDSTGSILKRGAPVLPETRHIQV